MKKRITAALLLLTCVAGAWSLASCSASAPTTRSTVTTQATTAPSTTVTTQATTIPTVATTLPTTVPTTAPKVILEKLQPLYEQNPHTAGWVQVEGTMINYPVMQTPDEAGWRDYYLHRNFYGEYEYRGTIYAREKCDLETPSDNIVLYGHNMADHTMFGEVLDYRYYDHYLTHKYIKFSNLYEEHTYEIFAVFRTSGTYGVGYPYYLFNEAEDEAAFDDFVAQCKALSLYDIELTPTYGQKLLTLSTCDFAIENGRLVVVAVRID